MFCHLYFQSVVLQVFRVVICRSKTQASCCETNWPSLEITQEFECFHFSSNNALCYSSVILQQENNRKIHGQILFWLRSNIIVKKHIFTYMFLIIVYIHYVTSACLYFLMSVGFSCQLLHQAVVSIIAEWGIQLQFILHFLQYILVQGQVEKPCCGHGRTSD